MSSLREKKVSRFCLFVCFNFCFLLFGEVSVPYMKQNNNFYILRETKILV